MIEVTLETLQMSLVSHHRVAVLREIGAERYLAILIGPFEAEAIANCLNRIESPRPQTHDLIVNILRALDANVLYVVVNALSEGKKFFYGRIVVEIDDQEIEIDSRPSDAMAIAVRVGAPIFVAEEVMDEAGIVPEPDILHHQTGDRDLGVFRKFLSTLDDEDTPT